jgi:hypothetical protein
MIDCPGPTCRPLALRNPILHTSATAWLMERQDGCRQPGTPELRKVRKTLSATQMGKQALRVVGIISNENNEPPHENRLLLDDNRFAATYGVDGLY